MSLDNKICEHALDREDFQRCKKCWKCNLKIYDEPVVCFEPEKWADCYFYFNYNNGKRVELWSEGYKKRGEDGAEGSKD